ncbi:alpha-ketoacid dehydrogenase subunit beta [Prochlorococcus marinus]|uniref:Alpha-ketoacid dehydrogenase subunit beta n=1 Tax=Prochlorococcus marinus XMU1408 TaxID=2213228 RepID=A0A318R116_PROMR|nr:transketolase C-terminal domain-containing protein [Prochlorococcus marinus]MBW3041838.1 alpha-ketoacid dehydrogenase subunit beta [Prochlorococcus marinus str. XMU1408]PYE02976.1 alpha-ketoacid dehydrogenase subunit beta [Prochlorococcus marinus XMU1408]
MSFNNDIEISYCDAIREAFSYLLKNYPEVFVIGQGLWSPWYVGNTMLNLDTIYGKDRVIDTPVSESATTGAALGAAITGMKPIVVHPRMDFMLYAMDTIVNQAAKWNYMYAGKCSSPCLTIRSIINRGGEQGAQHSQALHSLFSHIPGLRVVMPATPTDARDLLIASCLSPDPVLYIDDRWLYSQKEILSPIKEINLAEQGPLVLNNGSDLTIVACSYSVLLAKQAIKELNSSKNINSIELIDLRILNPLRMNLIINSVKKTGRLLVIDGGWDSCGIGSEIISKVCENIDLSLLKTQPQKICLPNCAAPSAMNLEDEYYPNIQRVIAKIKFIIVQN